MIDLICLPPGPITVPISSTGIVIVEIDGMLYLTRGGVFSYREFLRSPQEPRWTDEEWQEQLKQQPRAGEPSWMQEIIVPLDTVADDETFFYSSGC